MVVPRASNWRLFAELEQMGYDSAWVPDSQMIYSDTYAALALPAAADCSGRRIARRRRIRARTGETQTDIATAQASSQSKA
jgi:hypothetical protein